VWTGSPTNETSRDIVQAELLGGLGEKLGTGWVPRARMVGAPRTRQAGVKDVVDTFAVRHVSGGLSTCSLKTYEQGWQKWQGTAPHVVWLDEEPDDYMIYSEAQTRILTSKGIILVTFTPLLGVTDLVQHFQEGGPGIYLKGASWNDAPHLSDEDKARLSASYRDHERAARTQGVPMMGEGAVFPIPDEQITVQPFQIPDHFARIKGCDFGIDHPAAGVEIAWDRDQDCIYVIDCYRKANETAPYHAAWLNKANRMVPVAWPHDGMNREKSGGRTLADAYRAHGVNMLSKSARYPKVPGEDEKGGPQPVEPIVNEVLERMGTGRIKVFANLSEWFEEKRSYHRKDGLIVARRDDILKATFYAVMMRRYAMSLASFRMSPASGAPSAPIASTRVA
jgi:phage terminase large subunit-like protein